MKHIAGVTKQRPRAADDLQLIFCALNDTFGDLLAFKGGTSPAKEFTEDKCDLGGGTGV